MSGGGRMHLQTLYLENYRGFANRDINFGGKSTVLFGVNGVGKSSILQGISALLAHMITRITSNQFPQKVFVSAEDVRYGSSVLSIHADVDFEHGASGFYHNFVSKQLDDPESLISQIPFVMGEHQLRYGFTYNKNTKARRTPKNNLLVLDLFKALYLGEENSKNLMPVLVHYGVNRTVIDIPLRIRNKHEFTRLETYQNAMENKIDFRTFFEWFRNQEDYELECRNRFKDFSYTDPALNATRYAITKMLPNLSNIRVQRRPLRMKADKRIEDKVLPLCIEQLSDGEKCTLAMIGDLTRRLALANPESDNPLLGGGIVLIDEIELHMHPAWQRRIVRTLHDIFPNIQFIITTHSPQVIGDLPADFNLFSLEAMDRDVTITPVKVGMYDSNLVLEDIMQTDSINNEVRALQKKLFSLIDEKKWADAELALSELIQMTSGTAPSITKASILIKRGRGRTGSP